MDKAIVYFDGVCGLCNHSVDFLIKIDKKNKLLFAPLQGDTAQNNLKEKSYLSNYSTIIFSKNNHFYIKSDAAIQMMVEVGGIWKTSYILIIFPKFIRNWVYDFVARNRYRWFGKKENCRIPSKEERLKFLP